MTEDHPSEAALRAYAGAEPVDVAVLRACAGAEPEPADAVVLGAHAETAAGAAVDEHVAECRVCIATIAGLARPEETARGWERLDHRLDEPRRGPLERLLCLLGLREDLARVTATAPALHASWLGTAVFVVVAALATTRWAPADVTGLTFLAVFPVLPVAGAALSFGPRLDPTYELTLVSPLGRFPIILLRTLSVLMVLIGIAGLGSLAAPQQGPAAVAWLAPSFVLTLVTVALSVKMEPRFAAACAVAVWTVCVVATSDLDGTSLLLTAGGQLTAAGLAVTAGAAVIALRRQFDRFTLVDFPVRVAS